MTFREKLADWISGGALSKQKNVSFGWQHLYDQATKDYRQSRDYLDEWINRAGQLDLVLRDIINQETLCANATVKRMAEIARKALETE